jgi:hypothetical protein
MNVVRSAEEQKLSLQRASAAAAVTQPLGINFYETIPNYELTLDDFEVYALKRLKVRNNELSRVLLCY